MRLMMMRCGGADNIAFVGLQGYYKTSKEDAWRGMYCTGFAFSDRQMHNAGFNDHDIWLRSSHCGLIPLLIYYIPR